MVRSETAMSDKDGNWLKDVSALRLVGEGLEQFVTEGIDECVEEIVNEARTEAGLYGKEVCGQCTTHNAVPCRSNNGLCHYDECRNCKYHDKNDPLKVSRRCPLGICDKISQKIKKRHRYHAPNFKNTDASKWFENPWEIAKCFIPTDGYEGITNAEGTDTAGLLAIITNCKYFESEVDANLGSPENPFSKLRETRNMVFHSPGMNVSDTDLQSHIDLMLRVLEDQRFLAQDDEARDAASKIREIADSAVHVFCGEEISEQTADSDESNMNSVRKWESLLRSLPERVEGRSFQIWMEDLIDDYIGFKDIERAHFRFLISRDLSGDRSSYEQLFNKTNEQQTDQSQTADNEASPGKPNKPKPSIVIVFAVKSKNPKKDSNVMSKPTNSTPKQVTNNREQDGREGDGGGTISVTSAPKMSVNC